MYNTCLLLILLVFCHGSYGGDDFAIFLAVTYNNTKTLYSEDMVLNYNPGETALFVCSVNNDLYTSPGYHLTLSKNDIDIKTTKDFEIQYFLSLQESDDEAELKCEANSLTISANLYKIKTESEIMLGKPSEFVIVLMILGGILALSILIIICIRVIQCNRKSKSDEENGLHDVPLETAEIKYAEVDLKNKNKDKPKGDEPAYTEIGFVNQSNAEKKDPYSDQHKEQNKTSNNQIEKDNKFRDLIQEIDKRNSKNVPCKINSQLYPDLHKNENKTSLVNKNRHGSSTEC